MCTPHQVIITIIYFVGAKIKQHYSVALLAQELLEVHNCLDSTPTKCFMLCTLWEGVCDFVIFVPFLCLAHKISSQIWLLYYARLFFFSSIHFNKRNEVTFPFVWCLLICFETFAYVIPMLSRAYNNEIRRNISRIPKSVNCWMEQLGRCVECEIRMRLFWSLKYHNDAIFFAVNFKNVFLFVQLLNNLYEQSLNIVFLIGFIQLLVIGWHFSPSFKNRHGAKNAHILLGRVSVSNSLLLNPYLLNVYFVTWISLFQCICDNSPDGLTADGIFSVLSFE